MGVSEFAGHGPGSGRDWFASTSINIVGSDEDIGKSVGEKEKVR